VVTWNLDWWQRGSDQSHRVPVVLAQPAAVWLLQEVRSAAMTALESSWAGEVVLSVDVWPEAKRSWSSEAVLLPAGSVVTEAGCMEGLPRPQRGLWVSATTPTLGEVTLVSWHCENAAGGDDQQRRKMAAYRAMSQWLADRTGTVVLGADLNTWRDPVDLQPADPDDEFFEEHRFVGPDPAHGLVDAHRRRLDTDGGIEEARVPAPEGPLAVSYVLADGVGHRMDRIFVSPGLDVRASGYDLDAGRTAGSDHALHHADLVRPAAGVDSGTHASSSHEHLSAEAVILARVADEFGLDDLAPARLELDGVRVEVDGWSPSTGTAVEVYARVTKPKGGAVKKPMDDAMKLILVRRHHPDARLVLAFATDEVADAFRSGRGWRAAAIAAADIEVVSAGIDGELLEQLLEATRRQYR